jgi:HEAT repeat protein
MARGNALLRGLSIQEIITLIESLGGSEESYRQNMLKFNDAIHDLVAFGALAVEPLIDCILSTNSRYVAWATILALRDIGDRRAQEPLWTVYHKNQNDLGIQHDVLITLGKLKDERLFEILVPLLYQEKIPLRRAAIHAFGHLGDNRAIDYLVPLFDGADADVALSLAWALGDLKDKRALEPLIARAQNAEFSEKRAIIDALAKIGGHEAVQALAAIINSEDVPSLESSQYDRLRCDAVNAIAQIDDPSANLALRAAIQHVKRGVRRRARKALEKRFH